MSADILARAKRQFAQRRDLRGPILVPEWGEGDAPLELYYRIWNMKERAKVIAALGENALEGQVVALIMGACDAAGKPLFSLAQKAEFMHSVDPDVIIRVVNAMRQDDEEIDVGN